MISGNQKRLFLSAAFVFAAFFALEACADKDDPFIQHVIPVESDKLPVVNADPNDPFNQDLVPIDAAYVPDIYSFGRNPFLRNMQNQPFIDVPGDVGKVAFGGVFLVLGVPLVMIGETLWFPFSGERHYYPAMKEMYFNYYDFVNNDLRYTGYYLLALPFYAVKGVAWDIPIYLYESAFGADIEDQENYFPTVEK